MRILDKHYDFYDYLQNIYPDKTITFDRTKSFVLTKDMIKKCLEHTTYNHKIGQTSYILLQVCNRFWLFEAEITDINQYSYITNFSLERTASERRESIGLTNDEKITNHGFDVKVSFRNIKKK